MELKDYTTEELREELKRRRTQAIKEAKKSMPIYKEFTAVVKDISSNHCTNIHRWGYYLINAEPYNCEIDTNLINRSWNSYALKSNTFNKSTAPRKGDKVLLRYKRHKTKQYEIFDVKIAKIVEVLERSNN